MRRSLALMSRLRFSGPAMTRSTAAVKSASERIAPSGASQHRRLIDEMARLRAGESGVRARSARVGVGVQLYFFQMHLEDRRRPVSVGPVRRKLAVEATGAPGGGIQNLRAIGRRQ